MAFGSTAHANSFAAVSDLVNKSIAAGYTPSLNLDERATVISILANMMTTLPNSCVRVQTVAFDMASVAANITAEQAVTVTNVAATDICLSVIPATGLNAGLSVISGRVTSANQITIRISNSTAGALDPASQNYTFVTYTP